MPTPHLVKKKKKKKKKNLTFFEKHLGDDVTLVQCPFKNVTFSSNRSTSANCPNPLKRFCMKCIGYCSSFWYLLYSVIEKIEYFSTHNIFMFCLSFYAYILYAMAKSFYFNVQNIICLFVYCSEISAKVESKKRGTKMRSLNNNIYFHLHRARFSCK